MSDLAIKVQDLGKQYRIGLSPTRYKTLRETLVESINIPARLKRRKNGEELGKIWALRDISFDVSKGQVLGVIGRNGAGKSTLLKILSRVTEPSEGFAEIRGGAVYQLRGGGGFPFLITWGACLVTFAVTGCFRPVCRSH